MSQSSFVSVFGSISKSTNSYSKQGYSWYIRPFYSLVDYLIVMYDVYVCDDRK